MSDTIEQRIQQLENLTGLEKLINTYQWCVDQFDWQGWSECFTEDAEFDFPVFGKMRGRREIHDVCKAGIERAYGATQHMITNLDFDLTGPDTASGHGNLLFIAVPDPEKPDVNIMLGGRYDWEFKRTAAGWCIAEARLVVLWTGGH